MSAPQVLVLAKAPVPGRVKTRLCPPCTPEQAARIAAAALADTLDTVTATPAGDRVLVVDGRYPVPAGLGDARRSGADRSASGSPTRSPTPGRPAGRRADRHGHPAGHRRATSTRPAALRAAGGPDAVLGPAADGGWWALGLRDPGHAAVLRDHPDVHRDHREADPGRVAPPRPAGRTAAGAARRGHRGRRPGGGRAVPAGQPVRRAPVAADVPARRSAAARDRRAAVFDAALSRAGARASRRRVHRPARRAAAVHRFDPAAWCRDAIAGDAALLGRCAGPTLDVGCGPGRLTGALTGAGRPALGIDVSAAAVRLARRRGAIALRRDVFDPVPGTRPLAAPAAGRRQHRHRRRPGPAAAAAAASCSPRTGGCTPNWRRPAPAAGPARPRCRPTTAPGSPLRWAACPSTTCPRWPRPRRLRVLDTWTEAGRWFATLTPGDRRVRAALRRLVRLVARRRCRRRPRRCGADRCARRLPVHAAVAPADQPARRSRSAVAFGVCFLTGLLSHLIQHPPGWFWWPSRPVGLYRVTQGAARGDRPRLGAAARRQALVGLSAPVRLAAGARSVAHAIERAERRACWSPRPCSRWSAAS